jgi:hypothetical protein
MDEATIEGLAFPRRFSREAALGGREDCMSTRRSEGDGLEWSPQAKKVEI